MKPCPACSSKKTRVFAWDKTTIYGECLNPDCRMSGPIGKTVEEAVDKWDNLPRRDEKK